MSAAAGNNIKVVCRFRPPNALEQREGGKIVVDIDDSNTNVKLTSTSDPPGGFNYDRAFGMESTQEEIFEYGVRGIVEDVVAGYNGTVFAYGQTGSGKSFTMMGASIDDARLRGLIPRITQQIFDTIMQSPPVLEYVVKVSYMEIYMERIRDLLAPQNDNLPIHEDKARGVYVKNLSDFYVGSAEEVFEIMRQGGSARAVTATNMNAESSRSHSIFVITIAQRNTETGTQKTGNLYLVDLAGSEKVGKTGASGQTLEEAKKINKSLSALGMVINALTDGKSSHIPYRDSKLTRILQESLGGNSRTTLIINCSPCEYNEAETLSTLRFGMRAKSIKNKARINAELSPAELKALLKKAQRDVGNYERYIGMVEAELSSWRSGTAVDKAQWASMEKTLGLSAGEASALASAHQRATPETPASGRATPRTPALDSLRDLESRPQTPTAVGMEKDEREDFLRRENELTDQLAEKESALSSQEKQIKEMREELELFRSHESSLANDNKAMSTELNEIKLQLERLTYESKEAAIVSDATREQNTDLAAELEELRKSLAEAKAAQKTVTNEGKEKKKAEKLAQLMGSFDTGAVSEKEEQIRATLLKLDEAVDSQASLSPSDIAILRKQLADSQLLAREQSEKARQAIEDHDAAQRRRDELELRVASLEQECEELLDKGITADGGSELKARLDAQQSQRRDAVQQELVEAKAGLDKRTQEVKSLTSTVDELRSANEELKRAFAVTAAASEGGKNLADSAREMERIRRTMSAQLADFDVMKKSLMRDLQDRCEKVVELEISLDETREQYNTVLRNSNSRAQARKMEFLTRNLDQLAIVQRQLVEQNSSLKKDVALSEKRLLARNERIQNLETLLQDAQEKLMNTNARFEAQMQVVRERMEQARAQRPLMMAGAASLGNRIARPLRGGGGAAVEASPKSLDAKRSSWFFAS